MKQLKSILHVDDDADILDITKMSLELVGGYEVHQTANAEDALSKLQEMTPDLLLLDVMMPDIDGPSLLKEVREIEHLREVPVVFMTAKSENDVKERLSGEGILGVVTKPFDPMSLSDQLARLWNLGDGSATAA